MLHITEHGEERVRKRCGVPKKAVRKMVTRAFEYGLTHSETTGKLNKYITSLYFKNTNADNIRIYGDKVFIFSGTTLITVLNLPNIYKNLAKSCLERRVKGYGL